MQRLIKEKYDVLLETSGSLSIQEVPEKVVNIIDFKCPSSKMHKKNDWSIIDDMAEHDEIKFVIGNRQDYKWSKEKINNYKLENKTKNRKGLKALVAEKIA